ncbi:MAG: hypothetical protein ACQEQ0_13585 [Bacteroidota bacterium]
MEKLIGLTALLIVISCNQQTDKNPNVVLILTDDQGDGDFSIKSNPWFETPVIDLFVG